MQPLPPPVGAVLPHPPGPPPPGSVPAPPAPAAPAAPATPAAPRAPLGAAVVGAPPALQRGISSAVSPETLRAEGERLQQRINEVLAARSRGGRSDLEEKVRNEQLQKKEELVSNLQQQLQAETEKLEHETLGYRSQIQDYESQRAALKLQIQQSKAQFETSDAGKLQEEVIRAEERSRQLEAQLRRLEANSFLSKVDDRREANARISALEDVLRVKVAEHQTLVDDNLVLEQGRVAGIQAKQRLQAKCLDLKQRNEQLQVEIESQTAEMQKVEREMRLMRERLPPGNQEALEAALSQIVGGASAGAAFARLERPDPAVPSRLDLTTADSMERVVERLGQERDDLRRQISILRVELDRETAVSQNFKALQTQELEDARIKSQSFLRDREKWARIAAAHLQSIQDLQRRIAGFEDVTLSGQKPDDALSVSGFSDVSDLEDCENALDVFVGVGAMDLSAAERLQESLQVATGAPPPPSGLPCAPDELRTLVSIEFLGFDVGFTAVAAGLQPVYDSLVTFGPFAMTDDVLEQLSTTKLGVEIHGSMPGTSQQLLLGRGELPMAGLLQYGVQATRNPVAGGVVAVKDVSDPDILVAQLRVKMRMRYSMEELAEDFKTRAKVRQMDRGRATKTHSHQTVPCFECRENRHMLHKLFGIGLTS